MTARGNRAGFSLIEVMVALTMLALVTVSLARASMAISVFGHNNDIVAKRTAALQMEANKFEAIPFSSLATWSTADVTRTWGNFTYTRKLSITAQTSSRDSIKITIVPSSATTMTDYVTVIRTKAASSPLCTGC